MTEHTPNQSGPTPEGWSPGAVLRAAADAELTPEQLASLPSIDRREQRIAFERDLRDAVARSMRGSENVAPADLRRRIETLFLAEPTADRSLPAEDPPAGVVRTPMGDTRQRSFWSRVPGIGAIAAVLMLCATFVFFAVRQNQTNAVNPQDSTTLRASTLASFVHDEHQHCADDRDYADRKFKVHDLAGAIEIAREHFGAVPSILESGFESFASHGFDFGGLSRCAVPGKGKSVHLVFRAVEPPERIVSLFLQKDENDWRIADSRCARIHEGLPEDQTVTTWRRDGFFFFLFTAHQDDLETFHALLQVPAKQCSFSVR
jgi:hypothetical protein